MKKIVCCIVIAILIIVNIFPIISYSKITTYLATGDSIAYGYGLSNINTQSYPQIVKNRINISSTNFKNLAVSGMTCQEYYNVIQTSQYKTEIQKANLLTVSIGSNEVLELITGALSDVTGISANDPAFLTKVKQAFLEASIIKKYEMATAIYNFFTSQDTKNKINASIATYQEYWDKSVKYIKSINPNINIVTTEFYNPYYEVQIATFDLGGYVDDAIVKMNKILNTRSNNETDYKIAKIYQAFNTTNPRLTNVDIDMSITNFSMELDPHPNIAGHEMIATKVMDAIATIKETKKNISELTISNIPDQAYTGSQIKPAIIVKDGAKQLVENTDYTLSYINNTNIGEAKVSITGIGDYTGNVIKTFNIRQAEVVKKSIADLGISNIDNQIYTGVEVKPDVIIKDGSNTLVKNKDYSLSYQNNVNAGTGKAIIRGIGNYTGETTKNFIINSKNIEATTISDISKQTYTGSEIKPTVTVSDGSIKLIENKDYKLTYSNNKSIGTAKAKITGINNYSGEVNKTFEIVESNQETRKDISKVQCTEIEDKIYTGKLITPEVVLTDGQTILTKNVDYNLTYKDNLKIGTGTVIIAGMGNYTGKIDKNFKIVKKDINHTYIVDIEEQTYTGSEIKPKVTITNDKTQLEEGQDYKVEYKDNVKVGTAQIIITGINNFEGTVIKTFNIIGETSPQPVLDNDNLHNKPDEQDAVEKDYTVSNRPIPQTGQTAILGAITLLIIITAIVLKIWINKNK